MPATTMIKWKQFWRYARGLVAPVLLWTLFALVLRDPLQTWLQGDRSYDEAALREWIDESRVFRETLAARAREYLRDLRQFGKLGKSSDVELGLKHEALEEHLKALGLPTKVYPEQLPLFLTIY